MGIEQELFGIKNRPEGQEFKVIERADGSIAVLAGDKVLVDSGVTPVTAVPSGSGIRFIAPSGTVAADGTITLGTALPAVFSSGVYLWLPAGAISGGTAGWYWAVMSSSTVGVIAGVGSGSAYTGSTSEVTAFTFDVPTPSKGSASILRLAHMCSSNTNAKTGRFRVGGTQYMTNAINTAGHALFVAKLLITGLGDEIVSITSENGGGSSAGGILTGVGSSISINCTLQLSTATDYLGCAPAILQG